MCVSLEGVLDAVYVCDVLKARGAGRVCPRVRCGLATRMCCSCEWTPGRLLPGSAGGGVAGSVPSGLGGTYGGTGL